MSQPRPTAFHLPRPATSNDDNAHTQDAAHELWGAVCGAMQRRMSMFAYRGFLEPVIALGWQDQVLHLGAPTQFLLDWVRDHYEATITEEAARVCGATVKVMWSLATAQTAPSSAESATDAEAEATSSTLALSSSLSSSVSPPRLHTKQERVAERLRGRLQPQFTFDDLVVGTHNHVAVAAAREVCAHPGRRYRPLFVFGEQGTGKTHLLHAMGHELLARHPTLRVVVVRAEEWVNEYVRDVADRQFDAFRARYRQRCDVLIVDDVQFLAGKAASQDEFLHMFNALHDDGKQIILAGDAYPQDVMGLHEKLKSRFQWGLAVDVKPPDTTARLAILQQKAHERGCALPTDVAEFMSTHLHHNVRELEGALVRLHAYGQVVQQPLTLDIARAQLQPLLAGRTTITPQRVVEVVAAYYGLRAKDLTGPLRQRQVTRARQVAMWLCRQRLSMSYPEIGRLLGDRDHSTVVTSVKKIATLAESEVGLSAVLSKLSLSLFAQ
jgi:chromosomal replication initiator protein